MIVASAGRGGSRRPWLLRQLAVGRRQTAGQGFDVGHDLVADILAHRLTVYPQTHSIIASHSLDTAHIYHEDDTLTLELVIPGFAVPVSALFS